MGSPREGTFPGRERDFQMMPERRGGVWQGRRGCSPSLGGSVLRRTAAGLGTAGPVEGVVCWSGQCWRKPWGGTLVCRRGHCAHGREVTWVLVLPLPLSHGHPGPVISSLCVFIFPSVRWGPNRNRRMLPCPLNGLIRNSAWHRVGAQQANNQSECFSCVPHSNAPKWVVTLIF